MIDQVNRQDILGVNISVIDMPLAIETLAGWINARSSNYVCVTPAHSVMDCYWNSELREIFNQSGMTTPDGMAIVWLLKLYGHKRVSRVYGPDLLLVSCEAGHEKGWRHYFYGGKPGVAEQLVEVLLQQVPGLNCVGTFSPPFQPLTEEEKAELVEDIKRAKPDIVWVGLSSPKQESWMAEFVNRLDVPVLVGIGAAFDFVSGAKRQAPVWIQRSGFEWLFRLMTEPRRLWARYRQYPLFVALVIGQYFGLIDFSSRERRQE